MRSLSEFPSYNPGRLRQRITIEQPPATEDASGGRFGNWTVFAGVRAEVKPLGGTEQYGAETFEPEATHQVTIRFRAGLDSTMRVNYAGRLMEILNVNDIQERHRWMVLICKEGKSHGV